MKIPLQWSHRRWHWAVAPGTRVLTDGWGGYNGLPKHGYQREKIVVSSSGDPAHVSLPGVHRVASLLKRWILGTHQGARSLPITCSRTWRSLRSDSTGAPVAAVASSSTDSSNRPSSPGPLPSLTSPVAMTGDTRY